jgi:ankyrin repeat protein
MVAALFGSDEITRILLAAGADPNLKTFEGYTALMLAAMGGHAGVVKSPSRLNHRHLKHRHIPDFPDHRSPP